MPLAVEKQLGIRMHHVKLFAFMFILQYAGAAQNVAISTTDEGYNDMKASVDFTRIQEILSEHEQKTNEQESKHQKQISELREIIAKQDGQIKEMMKLMTESKGATPEQNHSRKDPRKTPDTKPANTTIDELEQRVENLEVSYK